jgi:hypothetical protein
VEEAEEAQRKAALAEEAKKVAEPAPAAEAAQPAPPTATDSAAGEKSKQDQAEAKSEQQIAAHQPQTPVNDAVRRSALPTSEQRASFAKDVQRLLAACKCYSGDINGNPDEIDKGLKRLAEHRGDAPRIELASANVGQFEDWLAQMGSIASEAICPQPDAGKVEAKEKGPSEAPRAKYRKTNKPKPSEASPRKPRAPASAGNSGTSSFGPSPRGVR